MKINNSDTIVFIGDSITDIKFNRRFAYKLKATRIYPERVAKELKKHKSNLKFYFKGIASNRTYHVYDRLTKDCIELKPNVVIMLIGVNDAWENYVPQNYPPLKRPMKPHMQEIYRRLKAELDDVRIIFLLPFMIDSVAEKYTFHEVLDKFREELKEMARENGAQIIDLQKIFNEKQKDIDPKKLATDGIHPTSLGHKIIAESILEIIE